MIVLTDLILLVFNNLFFKVLFQMDLLDIKYFANLKQHII